MAAETPPQTEQTTRLVLDRYLFEDDAACPTDQFVSASARQVKAIARLMDRAIVSWSSAAGVSPEEWLKRYRPVVRHECSDDWIRFVIEASLIEHSVPAATLERFWSK